MAIDKISALQSVAKIQTQPNVTNDPQGFKAILDSKRTPIKTEDAMQVQHKEPVDFTVKKMINDVIKSHEQATKSIKTFIASGAQHSPKDMLEIQFLTGEHYTKVQMVAKVAELTANTIKTVSQTPV